MGKFKCWNKIFPTEFSRGNHFLNFIGRLLIEACTSIGIDEWVVWDVVLKMDV